jgi:hypothetical protein
MLFFRLKKITLFNFLKENSFVVSNDIIKKIFDFIDDKIIGHIVFNDEIQIKINFFLYTIKRSYRKYIKRNRTAFYTKLENSEVVLNLETSQDSNSKVIEKLNLLIEHATLKIRELEKVFLLI